MEIDAVAAGGVVRVGMKMESGVMPEKRQVVFCALAFEGIGVGPPIDITVVDVQIIAVLLDVVDNRVNDDVATY